MRYCLYDQPVIFGVDMEDELEESRNRNALLESCTERYWKAALKGTGKLNGCTGAE